MHKFENKRSVYFLSAFIVLAILLRVVNINERGLAGDEKYSLFVSQFIVYDGNNQHNSVRKPGNEDFTPKEFWSEKQTKDFLESIARLDNGNGALYVLTLRSWIKIAGYEDGMIRLLPVIFNIATILLLFYFVKRHFKDETVALISVFLAVVSPFFLVYAQVNRTYSLLFFLSLLCTHLYLLIIDRIRSGQKSYLYLVGYGLTVTACLFCHVAIFPLFFVHGLYLILFHRNIKIITLFASAMLIPVLSMSSWLLSDGGRWMYEFVQNSTLAYNKMAETAPNDFLSLSTPKTMLLQLRHVLSYMYVSAEGLYKNVTGLTNLGLCLVFTATSVIVFRLQKLSTKQRLIIVSAILVIMVSLISKNRVHFFVLSVNLVLPLLLVDYIRKESDKTVRAKLFLLVIISVFSIVSLVGFAILDGNTFRIITRYSGYAYSFNLILLALIVKRLYISKPDYAPFIWLGLACQLVLLTTVLKSIYTDAPPHYFMEFTEPRTKNPYITVSELIQKNYAKHDTLFYPSSGGFINEKGERIKSVVDAQLINIYLPKDADYIQKINYNEPDKVILKKAGGEEITLFDFKGDKYRY